MRKQFHSLWLMLPLLLLLLISACAPMHAQTRFGAGAGLVVTTGDFKEFAGEGINANVEVYQQAGRNFAVTLNPGYTYYFADDIELNDSTGVDNSGYAIPILAAARFYLVQAGSGFYLNGAGGMYIQKVSTDTNIRGSTVASAANTETKFMISPGAGFEIDLSDNYHANLYVSYNKIFGEPVAYFLLGAGLLF